MGSMISLTPFLGGPEVASTLAAAPTPDDVTQVWHISTAAAVAMRVGEEMGDHDWSQARSHSYAMYLWTI